MFINSKNKFILLAAARCRQCAPTEGSAMVDPVEDAWTTLRRRLRSRSLALYDEVRTYPTPIARCDEQLTKAIEERDAAFRSTRLADELDRARHAGARHEWLPRLRAFVACVAADDDEGTAAACRRLLAALER
jgi:hypothetical protein